MLGLLCVAVYETFRKKMRSGEVYEKTYSPEKKSTTIIPMWVGGVMVSHPQTNRRSESWNIHIRAFDNKKGKWRYETFSVSEETYNEITIGEYIEFAR